MTLSEALRLTEILLGFAFAQQSLEHLHAQSRDWLFAARLVLALLLMTGLQAALVSAALFLIGVLLLHRFQGPYNGGSDRMGLLMLCCVCLAHWLPSERGREMAFGYLALQLLLSYFISGWVKIVNPQWRKGRALRDVFEFSAYPVSESLRRWAQRPRLLLGMAWAVMGFELLLPLSLLTQPSLYAALVIAAIFHLANAGLFGLNRFFWIWIAAYPSLLWFQQRVLPGS